MKKYNLKNIMNTAWNLFKANRVESFGEALRKAWENAKMVKEALKDIKEEVKTWFGWTQENLEVIHESKCVAQVNVWDAKTKSGRRVISYFTKSQTCPLGSQE